jgi:hypothetical protein
MKFIRIFLLVLIVIGIGLLVTQSFWVPPFVNWILAKENKVQAVQPVSTSGIIHATTTSGVNKEPSSPVPQETGTLFGSVTLSPTCPVERIPPDPQCSPKPYVTGVKVLYSGGMKIAVTGETESDGSFKFSLAPGMYVVEVAGGTVYPRCSPVNAQVMKGTSTTVAVICDTGIR